MRIGFCGLGNMGMPMAERLLDAGHAVAVWNRTSGRTDPLVARGARAAATPTAAADGAEGVITMLADPEAVEEVVFGTDGVTAGVAAGLAAGATLIDMSTVDPGTVRSVASRLPSGVEMLDAPVRGGPARAVRGELKILVGGAEPVVRHWTPLLQAMGEVRHVGPLGAGSAAKVLNNFVGISLVSLLGEAISLADALGIDPDRAIELLRSTPIRQTLEHQWPRAQADAVPPSFRLRLAAKDLRLATETAAKERAALRMGQAALDWLRAAGEAGLAEHDQAMVIAHIRASR